MNAQQNTNGAEGGRGPAAGLVVFVAYVLILAAAAASEVFELGWFDSPVFK